MQVFVRGDCTVIAAAVQCDVDGVPKGSHFARVPADGVQTLRSRRRAERAIRAQLVAWLGCVSTLIEDAREAIRPPRFSAATMGCGKLCTVTGTPRRPYGGGDRRVVLGVRAVSTQPVADSYGSMFAEAGFSRLGALGTSRPVMQRVRKCYADSVLVPAPTSWPAVGSDSKMPNTLPSVSLQ
jgi:hypothetical protein